MFLKSMLFKSKNIFLILNNKIKNEIFRDKHY